MAFFAAGPLRNKLQCSNNFWFNLHKLANSNFVRFDEDGDEIENTFWELATFNEKHVLKVWIKRTRKCRYMFSGMRPLSWSFLLSSTFENKKFVDNAQQWFAFTPQANFPAHILNFHWRWRWWDRMQAIFLNLFYFTDSYFFWSTWSSSILEIIFLYFNVL